MMSSWVRWLRIGVIVLVPLLAASTCNDAELALAYRPIFSAPVGRPAVVRVRLENRGGVDATLGEVSAAALGLAPPFSVVGGSCTSGAIVPKSYGSCLLELAFTATEAREYSDTFTVNYTWGDGAGSGTLSALATGTGEPPLRTSWDSRTFRARPLGTVTETTFTVRNAGGYVVTLGDVRSDHLGLAAPFSAVGGTCLSGAALLADATCTMLVRFSPNSVDTFEDALEFTYNWPQSKVTSFAHRVGISGSSVVPVSITANPVILPPVNVASTALQGFVLRNEGGQVAVLGTIDEAALGIAAPFSLVGGTCSTGLALASNGGSCTLEVAFSPRVPGAATGGVSVAYGWAGAPDAFSVSLTIPASGVATSATDCYPTGCGEGQVCARLTSSASGARTCVSVPDPPPGCMAPCVWETRRKCLPVLGACNAEKIPDPNEYGREAVTYCDADTRWAILRDIRFGSVPFETQHRRDGATCYSSKLTSTSSPNDMVDSDGAGPIAVSSFAPSTSSTERVVWCGPYTSSAGLDPAQGYRETLSAPECLAWRSTYLDWTNCRTSTAGSCSGF